MADREVATLGGGCFWCLEAVYEQLRGVESVVSGYAGGAVQNPSYRDVCSGRTGHAEVVQVTFDPAEVSYREILEVFFTIHDPTTLNRQGADVGTQYRSTVLYHDDVQRGAAEATIAELEREGAFGDPIVTKVMRDLEAEGVWDEPIVTQIEPLPKFFPAEDYHQHYFARNAQQPYCQVVVAPKVAKFRQKYLSRLRQPA